MDPLQARIKLARMIHAKHSIDQLAYASGTLIGATIKWGLALATATTTVARLVLSK